MLVPAPIDSRMNSRLPLAGAGEVFGPFQVPGFMAALSRELSSGAAAALVALLDAGLAVPDAPGELPLLLHAVAATASALSAAPAAIAREVRHLRFMTTLSTLRGPGGPGRPAAAVSRGCRAGSVVRSVYGRTLVRQ